MEDSTPIDVGLVATTNVAVLKRTAILWAKRMVRI